MSAAASRPDAERYDAAVARLFARRPERMVPGLERIAALCGRLGQPQRAAAVVHLTGTNGKTSLARMIASLLEAHRLRTGTYTSPHLQDVRERVRIGDRPISREAMLAALAALDAPIAAVEADRGEMVTFFETLTALAYRQFAVEAVDTAVVEVGMGGRWDATNVADADVAVLNPVRLDHAELGSTVAEVAGEKAGIITAGAPAVLASQDEVAARILHAEARRVGAPLLVAERDFGLARREPAPEGQRLDLRAPRGAVDGAWLPLLGAHQAANAAVALAAVDALLERRGLPFDADAARAGLAAVRSPGRLEVVEPADGGPTVVLDGAHNPAGAAALAEALGSDVAAGRRVLVVGAMGDKDCAGILDALLPAVDDVVATEAPTGRSAPAERLAKLCRLAGREARAEGDLPAALAAARSSAGPDDVVVVTGSLYLVGAARDALGLPVA
ncbi:MAG: bifunctional folylpolyglutamate synthase/dihydrofolate synthase [Actinomycetota bacterium]